MTKPEELRKYFEEIPKEYRGRACIAGGAVLDLERATDVDIFILRCEDMEELDRVKEYVEQRYSQVEFPWSDSDSSDKKAIMFNDAYGKKINVVCTEEHTMRELIENFDISTSRWAIDIKGNLQSSTTSTKPGEPITVFYLSHTTLFRIQKYVDRFGTGWLGVSSMRADR